MYVLSISALITPSQLHFVSVYISEIKIMLCRYFVDNLCVFAEKILSVIIILYLLHKFIITILTSIHRKFAHLFAKLISNP